MGVGILHLHILGAVLRYLIEVSIGGVLFLRDRPDSSALGLWGFLRVLNF